MDKSKLLIIAIFLLLSCSSRKGGDIPKDETIEEVEFVKGVEENDDKESPSMYDERYATPIEGKEGNPKDDLVKESNEDEIFGFDE